MKRGDLYSCALPCRDRASCDGVSWAIGFSQVGADTWCGTMPSAMQWQR